MARTMKRFDILGEILAMATLIIGGAIATGWSSIYELVQ